MCVFLVNARRRRYPFENGLSVPKAARSNWEYACVSQVLLPEVSDGARVRSDVVPVDLL
jgi:hypothetical protein